MFVETLTTSLSSGGVGFGAGGTSWQTTDPDNKYRENEK
jgi:hypothetical protein